MNEFTCVVIGAGYAGIHAMKEIRINFEESESRSRRKLRLVLLDKNGYHLRKVLLFKPAAQPEDITVPITALFQDGVECITATVTRIAPDEKQVHAVDPDGRELAIGYDMLVVAAGSIVRSAHPDRGGISLTSLDTANQIRQTWQANMIDAVNEPDAHERQRLLTTAIAGAGISGIETAAELAHYMKDEAKRLGLDPKEVRVLLVNAGKRLFPDGPSKVGHKLEAELQARGITILHETKALHEKNGLLALSDGSTMPVGLCIWTLGLLPHPMLRNLGLPLTEDGYIRVDACYRVEGAAGVYSIGDCARIVDPSSGRADGKTCKEAIAQAARLGKIMLADADNRPAPSHKRYRDTFCFGLGPDQGMVWIGHWGIHMLLTGSLGWRLRKYTWDMASLL